MRNRNNQSGFTLVELSISLVIIGLLIVGVLLGQSIIKAAKIRSVVNDLNNYQGAFNLFQTKYSSMPGDIVDASSQINNVTMNGNGDSQIVWAAAATCIDSAGGAANCSEGALAWVHLSQAGMVPNSFSGAAASDNAVIGTNIPSSKISGAGYSFDYDASTGNHLHFAAESASGINDIPALSPTDAKNIDSKVDDGDSDTGRVQKGAGLATCVAAGNYDLSQGDSKTCTLNMQMDASN